MAGPARVHGLNKLAQQMTRENFVGYCPEYCSCSICQNAREVILPPERYIKPEPPKEEKDKQQ